MKIELKEEVYTTLKEICLNIAKEEKEMTVDQIAVEMMNCPEVPMHYPYHHFIVPAAFLTAVAMEKHMNEEELNEMLERALERSKNVLGGFCGNYGACGAGIGAGIFMSIYTDTSPVSTKTWQWANEITGICLQAIAKVPGPRCCKRTAFLSMEAAVPYINEKLKIAMKLSPRIQCHFYEKNAECKKKECPFYSE